MNKVPNMINLLIDGVSITAPQGSNLLAVCQENDIYIPHLCFLEGEDRPTACCRLCFVEIEEMTSPVPACTVTVTQDLKVKTNTEIVRGLQRSGLRMLLSIHDVDCKKCFANHKCELQTIAKFLQISLKPSPLPQIDRPKEIDTSHPHIDYYSHRCVLCGKCIRVCRSQHGLPAFSFIGRGIDTAIHHYPQNDQLEPQCLDCQSCIDICPVGALKKREAG